MTQTFNYFNYFTEIEDRFQQRRGALLLLSTLDWALIETWREAGIPLEAVLRGIDAAFDKYEARQRRASMRRVNGLAWCAQAVMQASEELREAGAGTAPTHSGDSSAAIPGYEPERVAAHLLDAAATLESSALAHESCVETANRLKTLAAEVHTNSAVNMEELERTLVVLEEKLFSALTAAASVDLLVSLKEQAARELAAYRSRLTVDQLRQVEKQFVQKRLLEFAKLPRLSLFYMHS